MSMTVTVADKAFTYARNHSDLGTLICGSTVLSLTDHNIQVTAETTRMPGAAPDLLPYNTCRRLRIDWNMPAYFRANRQKDHFFLKVDGFGGFNAAALISKLKEGIRLKQGLSRPTPQVQNVPPDENPLTPEEFAAKQNEIEAQAQARKELAAKRSKVFEDLVVRAASVGKIESSLQDQYVNVTLPNSWRVRIEATPEGTKIDKVEIPVDFQGLAAVDFINNLARI